MGLRTGLVRLQMPIGEWSDYQKNVGARSSRPILQIPTELPPNISWNKQTAVDEADKILNGEMKCFFPRICKNRFSPNWHKDPISGIELDATKHWSQLSDDHVVARSPKGAEAIPNDEETASAKTKGALAATY